MRSRVEGYGDEEGRGLTRRQTLGAAAAVDIWQCNAYGVYSDESSENTVGAEYLRGIQFTDADGYAELKTIYPGHHQGRATHVHVRVHIGGKRTKTTYSGGHICDAEAERQRRIGHRGEDRARVDPEKTPAAVGM